MLLERIKILLMMYLDFDIWLEWCLHHYFLSDWQKKVPLILHRKREWRSMYSHWMYDQCDCLFHQQNNIICYSSIYLIIFISSLEISFSLNQIPETEQKQIFHSEVRYENVFWTCHFKNGGLVYVSETASTRKSSTILCARIKSLRTMSLSEQVNLQEGI